MSSSPNPTSNPARQEKRPPCGPMQVGVLNGGDPLNPLERSITAANSWCVCERASFDDDNDFGALNNFDVMLLLDSAGPDDDAEDVILKQTHAQLELLRKRQVGVMVSTRRPWRYAGFDAGVVCVTPDVSVDVARGILTGLAHVRPFILQLDKQYAAMQRLGKSLARRFEATNRELQLASRLQRDFLPHDNVVCPGFKFSTLFRPCSWVSGDIFDIFRLDETHWGFYLADAVGHGVAAGLLTMYIKHAIRPKRLLRDGYEIVSPSEVLSHLNDLLAQQGLPDSQFITGWYGVLNSETNALRYAVAGHPPAMLIDPAGEIRELHGDGCLLGINCGEQFSDESVTLRTGDRIFLYSDGLEPTLISHRPPMPRMPVLESGMQELLRMPADALIDQLRVILDTTPGSLTQADDVSVLVLDMDASDDATNLSGR